MADLETSILVKIWDAFTGPLKALQTGLSNTEEAAKKVEQRLKLAADLNQAAEAAGRMADMIRVPLEDAVREFMGFEKAMSKVAALSGEIKTEGFERMRDLAQKLGAETAYSSEEAAEAMQQYAQAGRSVNEILEITPMTLAAAAANGTNLAQTAAIIGHTMSGMGIATSETAHVVDVLTAAASASDMSLGDMGTALAYVAPVARQAGMSLELTTAYLGKLKDAGIEASSAGTGMRAVIARLLDPSKEATAAFAKMHINTKALAEIQKQVATGHLDEALRRIGDAAAKLPNEQRMKLLSQIFGIEASTSANVMISTTIDASTKGVTRLAADLQHVDGTAQRLADVMQDNLAGAMERAGGAISGMKTAVGEALAPTVKTAAGHVEGLAGAVQAWAIDSPNATRATLELVAGVGLTAATLKTGLIAMSAYESATAMLSKTYGSMSQSLMGRMGLVAAAGLAGYAIGKWADDAFQIHERFRRAIGLAESTTERGLKPGGDQVTAGGWKLSGQTGEVLEVGTGPAPARVRAAYASGASSLDEVNAYLRKTKDVASAPNAQPFRAPLDPRRGAAQLLASPIANVEPGTEKLLGVTEQQTTALVSALERLEKNLSAELRKTQAVRRREADAAEARFSVY